MNDRNMSITTEEFDRLFDENQEDITPYLDMSSAKRINQRTHESPKRVNVDFSAWMLKALDQEALRLNISRQAVIKTILDEKLRERGFARVGM